MTLDYEKQFSSFFHQCGDVARSITLKHFRNTLIIDEKEDRSPVTEADREIETALRDLMNKTFPDHGIVGEEWGRSKEDAEFVWVIDPIDGTRAFMTGKPLFGTILGLMHNGIPVAGLLDQGFTKERWFGIANTKATHNGQNIHVASSRDLKDSRLYIGSPNMFDGKNFHSYLKLCHDVKWPQYGCDCYAYGLQAMGFADVVVEQNLKIHDVVGIAPIVTGAGGYICDFAGQSITMNFSGTVIAASSESLAKQVMHYFNT